MRLDVLKRSAMAASEFAERAHLINDVVDEFFACSRNLAPPEALQIVVPRMGADTHAIFAGKPHGFIDQIRVSGVKSGGNIGGADMCHQGHIVRITNSPAPERFAHIAIDVDNGLQCSAFLECPAMIG
jgi:hypothetical protein